MESWEFDGDSRMDTSGTLYLHVIVTRAGLSIPKPSTSLESSHIGAVAARTEQLLQDLRHYVL